MTAPDAPADPGGVWILTDGRPGNENPAAALARALEAHGWPPAERRHLALRPAAARLPPFAWALLGARERGWPFAGLVDPSVVARPWPDLVISAGRRAAPVAAAMRRLSGGGTRAVQLLDSGLSPARFDAVVTPDHDRRAGSVATLGSLSAVTPRIAAAAARDERRFDGLPRPRVAVLLGGPSRSARWSGRAAARLVDDLARLSGAAALLVTPSRRTPPELVAALRARLPDAWIWDGTGANPYPALLGAADAAVVTADSVNMASEAASAGLPVLVADVARLAPKLVRFHAALAGRRSSRPFRGALEVWPVEPLREAERAAAAVAARLRAPYGPPDRIAGDPP